MPGLLSPLPFTFPCNFTRPITFFLPLHSRNPPIPTISLISFNQFQNAKSHCCAKSSNAPYLPHPCCSFSLYLFISLASLHTQLWGNLICTKDLPHLTHKVQFSLQNYWSNSRQKKKILSRQQKVYIVQFCNYLIRRLNLNAHKDDRWKHACVLKYPMLVLCFP